MTEIYFFEFVSIHILTECANMAFKSRLIVYETSKEPENAYNLPPVIYRTCNWQNDSSAFIWYAEYKI